MSAVKPFRGFRPEAKLVSVIASVPYDVVDSKEAAALAEGNPLSFLHATRPEIDLPPGTDIHADEVYLKGAENFRKLVAEAFYKDREPCFYLYRQTMDGRSQTGLVCLCSAKEYEDGLIKKHEHTRRDKEDDRTRYVLEHGANAEPVFLVYRTDPAIESIFRRVCAGAPVYDFTTSDGIGHALWVVEDQADIKGLEKGFSGLNALYVADGHHRTAAAARYAQAMRGKGGKDSQWFMAVVFPHDQLYIMDYNRVVKDLNGFDENAFIKAVEKNFTVTPSDSPRPPRPKTFGMHLGGSWYLLSAKKGTYPAGDPVGELDVSILQNNLLGPVLGIDDPRTNKRIDFVGGIRGTVELERRVKEGAAVAFSMYPTSLEQVMAVADSGEVMPPKSTWFEPKLRSGLVVRIYGE